MIYDKICVAPHQIVDEDLDIQEVGHNGAEYYLRADKVVEVINRIGGTSPVVKKSELIKEIEAL